MANDPIVVTHRVPSPRIAEFVKSYETCRLSAYYATADEKARGIATIGWGETKGVKIGMVWTQAQADERFATRFVEFGMGVQKLVGGTATSQQEFDALCALAYNIGLGTDGLAGSTLLKLHTANRHDLVPEQFMRWVHQGGKVLAGLVERREREADIYAHGVYRDHNS